MILAHRKQLKKVASLPPLSCTHMPPLNRVLCVKVFRVRILNLCTHGFFSSLYNIHMEFGGVSRHNQQTFSFISFLLL